MLEPTPTWRVVTGIAIAAVALIGIIVGIYRLVRRHRSNDHRNGDHRSEYQSKDNQFLE